MANKIGDPKGKKEISKSFRELENFGFLVWAFSDKKSLRRANKFFVDYVIAGHGKLFFIELKIGVDKLSDGQEKTRQILSRTAAEYHLVTELNYHKTIEHILWTVNN